MRFRNVLVAACLTAAALVFPMLERVAAQSSTGIMISEFRFRVENRRQGAKTLCLLFCTELSGAEASGNSPV